MTDPSPLVTCRQADLKHILDVYIDNGMVETEDQGVVERLWREATRTFDGEGCPANHGSQCCGYPEVCGRVE